jgi:mannose-6-phosphate isomerase-like protein (cupin superfamily)
MNNMHKPAVVNADDVYGYQGICGQVKELLNPSNCDISNLDIAFITVDPGKNSQPHSHRSIEEVYYILTGSGEINVGNYNGHVKAGHAIYIPKGDPHTIKNISNEPLVLLAINSPPYDPSDVTLVDIP